MTSSRSAQTIVNRFPGPSYSFLLSWEENHDSVKAEEMFKNNIHVAVILAIGIYLPVLYFGQKLMANREPFKLRAPLIVWNSALAIFSIIGFSRLFPEFLYTFQQHGFTGTVCDNSWLRVKPASFWIYLFVLSKIPELVDTLFLVLKKQRLIFLHVYHHSSVLIFAWLILANSLAATRWYCVMNFAVHSVMYTYYALKALPNLIRIPKWISMVITTSQTLQMIFGTLTTGAALREYLSGHKCATNISMSLLALGIYFSYLVLFSHFFFKSYCSATPMGGKKRD